MSGKHSRPPVSAEAFDAQWEHSKRMSEGPGKPLQERVDSYVEARRTERERWQREQKVMDEE